MKNVLILSEAIYNKKYIQVNQGSFLNLSVIMSDVFKCFGLSCCVDKSDYYIRKSYVKKSMKKPGPNWTSLNKIMLDIYNCVKGTTYCPTHSSDEWWITTDIIRPKKTIETISFTAILLQVMDCCQLVRNLITNNSICIVTNQGTSIAV
jgi:hypothetical protein